MAIIKCPECGQQMSDNTKTCPHCGYNIKKHFTKHDNANSNKFVYIAIIVALCIIGWIAWRAYTTKTEQEAREAAQEWLDNYNKREVEHYLNK